MQHDVEKVWPTTNLDQCGANLMSNQCPTCGASAELREPSDRYQRTWQGSKRVQLTDVSQYPKARVPWETPRKNRNWSASICTLFANSIESSVAGSAKWAVGPQGLKAASNPGVRQRTTLSADAHRHA